MKKILFTAASIALLASSANAKGADNYYGKVALGWGYAPSYKVINNKNASYNHGMKGKGILGTLGVGYSANNSFRSDVEFYIDDGLKGKKSFRNASRNVKVNTYAGFLNAYYDFHNSSKFSPFIMGGIGYARNKIKFTTTTTATGDTIVGYSKAKGGVGFQLGFGVGHKVGNTVFELGYRFIDKGVKKITTDTGFHSLKKSSGQIHAGLLGVRLSF